LEARDSLPVPQRFQMSPSVDKLSDLYGDLQLRHRPELEALKYSFSPTSKPSSLSSSEVTSSVSVIRITDAAEEKQQELLQRSQSWLLIRALLVQQRRALVATGALRLINTIVQAFPALLVKRLLQLIEHGNSRPLGEAIRTSLLLVAVLSVKMATENQFFHKVVQFSTNVRGSVSGVVFDKSLRLSGGGSGVTHRDHGVQGALGTGGVLNLLQSDAGMIESAAMQLHTLWDGPLQIAIYSTLLFRYLGPPVLWGMAVLLLTIPVNSVALRILNRLARYENQARDARTKRTAESIRNMKLLKLQGWERRFEADIRLHRSDELRRHVARGIVRALNTAFSNAVPALVLVVTLTAYVRTGQPLVASTIFTAISLFNQLRFPLFFYPMLIDSLANGKAAVHRVASYLSAEEIVPYVSFLPVDDSGGGSIELANGNFLWPTQKSTSSTAAVSPALVDANVRVGPGEVVAVIGGVGSGKSALLKALLGELTPAPRTIVQQAVSASLESSSSGKAHEVHVPEKSHVVARGNVAYCSQEAWLPKGSIRDAVVFGREYDDSRYRTALYDAGLDSDFASGVLSDDTDVGEGGASLSGGQRARAALARALYSGDDTKVFLLDDCLAALDASVGSLVFERLTKRLRQTNASAVLVTNDPSIPRRCDRVILMEKVPTSSSCAAIKDVGTYDELIGRGHDLRRSTPLPREANNNYDAGRHPDDSIRVAAKFDSSPKLTSVVQKTIRVVGGYEGLPNCTESTCHAEPDSQTAMECCPNFLADNVVPVSPEIPDDDALFPDVVNETSVSSQVLVDAVANHAIVESKGMSQKMTSADDAMTTGAVPLSTYVSYLRSVRSPLLIGATIASYLLANGAQFSQQYTIAKWTEATTEAGAAAASAALAAKYMGSLVNAALVISVFLWLRSFLTMKVGVRASDFLHGRMLSSVFAAPMSFFDATPSGQILSRFGKEIETVDRGIPDSIASVLFCFLQIFMSVAALVGVVTPVMTIPLAVVSAFYVRSMALFRPAARDMKRAGT
jgi:ABC-type multidrug transport system fused ATPase/permease subunit